jgi:hypothetical protein
MARPLTMVVSLLAALVLGTPAAGSAAQSVSDTISGLEYFATSTHGKFLGTADGTLPGGWNIDVRHTKLCVSCSTTARITAGNFQLATKARQVLTLITGTFSGGTVQVVRAGAHCTNQAFAVDGVLGSVGPWHRGKGRGSFRATLTHYRRSVFGRCVTYAASVKGSLRLSY